MNLMIYPNVQYGDDLREKIRVENRYHDLSGHPVYHIYVTVNVRSPSDRTLPRQSAMRFDFEF